MICQPRNDDSFTGRVLLKSHLSATEENDRRKKDARQT